MGRDAAQVQCQIAQLFVLRQVDQVKLAFGQGRLEQRVADQRLFFRIKPQDFRTIFGLQILIG